MRILLSTSPHVRHPAVLANDFKIDGSVMYSFAPVGIMALISATRERARLSPRLFDLNAAIREGKIPLHGDFYANTAEMLIAAEPDVLGFMTECDSYHHLLQVAAKVKAMRPGCRVVLGGPHATAVAARTMARHPSIDAIVLGEGEISFPGLLDSWSRGSVEPPAGCLVRGRNGEVLSGGAAPLIEDLDCLPIPAYEVYSAQRGEEIFIEAGRGCPFQCTFCSTAPFWSRKHRVKSPGRLLSEIRIVQQLFDSKRVHFTHDLLTTDRHWLEKVCQALIDAGCPVRWTCSARTDTVDEPLLELMGSAGCNAIYFGIESGSPRILREIKKEISTSHSLEVLRRCRQYGITPNAGFIVGFPTEDETSLEDTFRVFELALHAGGHPTHIFGFCPFAQSSLFSSLGGMKCDGHYLDLPLERELDANNRTLVAQDQDLYGSYFRPESALRPLLSGIDEFSCLVESVLVPALELARARGGMLSIYREWIKWISSRNRQLQKPRHRLYYGSLDDFCEFVIELLHGTSGIPAYIVELAEVIAVNISLTSQSADSSPTSMASYRSIALPPSIWVATAADRFQVSSVLRMRRLNHDLGFLLSGNRDLDVAPPCRDVYLVWYLAPGGQVVLAEVSAFLYFALETLANGPAGAVSIITDWAASSDRPPEVVFDWDQALEELTEAQATGMVAKI